jgi:hypothetical protein
MVTTCEITDNRHRAKLPENTAIIVLSGQNGKLINGWAYLKKYDDHS